MNKIIAYYMFMTSHILNAVKSFQLVSFLLVYKLTLINTNVTTAAFIDNWSTAATMSAVQPPCHVSAIDDPTSAVCAFYSNEVNFSECIQS